MSTRRDKQNQLRNSTDGELVKSVTHWGKKLFSFRIERPKNFRFRSGEFVMIGLPNKQGNPTLRAYSIASPTWSDELEFYSIKVPNGKLTSKLQLIKPGDRVILGPKSTGTLVLDALLPGKMLLMFAGGTGIAPFSSLVQDPETYDKFDRIILTHTCRNSEDLDYGRHLISKLASDPLIGELAKKKVTHYTALTREPHPRTGRITDLLRSGIFFSDLSIKQINPSTHRAMICGSMDFNLEVKQQLSTFGLNEGANNRPAEFVLEKAFVG